MTAEQIQEVYWTALREAGDWKETSGNQPAQKEMQLKAWDTVIAAVRKDYELEGERLRQENRLLLAGILNTIERDGGSHEAQRQENAEAV